MQAREEGLRRRVGVAVVGIGGAVATTAAAGIALMRSGGADAVGLPLASLPGELGDQLVAYDGLVLGGWDLDAADLASAAATHRVLDRDQMEQARPALEGVRPWPAVGNARFCRNVDGEHRVAAPSHRAAVDAIRADLRRFRTQEGLDGVVMVNLASTEAQPDVTAAAFQSAAAFEAAVDGDDPALNPAVLYAYAAIREGVPYVNFTPSVAADVPALVELAHACGVPLAGKDGKTGQTLIKTVLAPALRDRALHVDGWYSNNILGNRDGLALADGASLASKLGTKGSVLDSILGYPVEDHVVNIHYYRPRGDNKEAWDTVDLVGFLGQTMQLKVNFLCRDSILAAPLVIELARLMDLAGRRGERGPQEQLGGFFKSPMTAAPQGTPEHAFAAQQDALLHWLAAGVANASPSGAGGRGAGAADDASDAELLDVEGSELDELAVLAAGIAPLADVALRHPVAPRATHDRRPMGDAAATLPPAYLA